MESAAALKLKIYPIKKKNKNVCLGFFTNNDLLQVNLFIWQFIVNSVLNPENLKVSLMKNIRKY